MLCFVVFFVVFLPKIEKIMIKSAVRTIEIGTGEVSIFGTEKDVARELGVSQQAVNSALKRGACIKSFRLDRVKRIFVVKTSKMQYHVCTREDGESFRTLNDGSELNIRDVVDYRDVTRCMWT